MRREKLLVDSRGGASTAKRVIASDSPDGFRPAMGKVGQRILEVLASGPRYPADIARSLGVHHQTVYYHIGRLEGAGLVTRVSSETVRGGRANLFGLSADGYAVEFPVRGEQIHARPARPLSGALGRFFKEFLQEGEFDGWIVVGSPLQHGAEATQARDGHYAVQLGFALGQFVTLPSRFPVKLDVDLRAEGLTGSNLVVVGGPRANVMAEALNPHLPIRFKQGSFWGSIAGRGGRSYSSELDCIVAKIRNPWNSGRTCVLAAGLTGAGTKAAIIGICNYADVLFQNYRSGEYSALLRGVDKDGDGKVDSVDVLES